MKQERIYILEIANGMVKHSEGGLITVASFPSIPKVKQEWFMETQGFRIVKLTLLKDVDEHGKCK